MSNLRVIEIIRGTTVDGPGFRTSIYFAGCTHHCPECHNPQTWDFGAGEIMSSDEIMQIIDEEDFDVTFSGGDPMDSAASLIPLARKIRSSGRGLWIYTGYLWEEIVENVAMYELATLADVIVDGPFVKSLQDDNLPFRGSSNQRIIKVKELIYNT